MTTIRHQPLINKNKKKGGVLCGQLLYKGKPSTFAKAVEEVHLIKSFILMQLQLTTTQAAASSYFLLFDKDELVITDALLHNLLSLAKHSGLKRLLSFQIGQRRADGGYEWTNTHKVKHEYLLVETLNLSV